MSGKYSLLVAGVLASPLLLLPAMPAESSSGHHNPAVVHQHQAPRQSSVADGHIYHRPAQAIRQP